MVGGLTEGESGRVWRPAKWLTGITVGVVMLTLFAGIDQSAGAATTAATRSSHRLHHGRPSGAPSAGLHLETTGGAANTWTNYSNAGGTQGPTIPAFSSVQISCALNGFRVADGNTWWYQIASSPWSYTYYVSADAFYNNGATSGSLIGTPFVDPAVPNCGSPAPNWPETTGGIAHTWTNYTNAGGTQGPAIGSFQTVEIACAVTGFRVADGNTWWYQIASSPWNNVYYVSADAFYNNGVTSGPLAGTPFVDPAVPQCGVTNVVNEVTGGAANTWSDYLTAGGSAGPPISAFASVQVTCAVSGFQVADGNTWWYRIASSPWNNGYYASADAFYNNGATSGSLLGTPFVDPVVPVCTNSLPGLAETAGGVANTWTDYLTAGGTQGPTIGSGQSVEIACALSGFKVADGNTWWYQIASSPWNRSFYVSADAFYNNGATSGSLIGTPFVDPAVPLCAVGTAPKGITTALLPNGTVKLKYSATLAASGGTLPYKWSLAAGSAPLPPGLKLSSKGIIAGRPKTAGTYSFTVQVLDHKTKSIPATFSTRTLTITVMP